MFDDARSGECVRNFLALSIFDGSPKNFDSSTLYGPNFFLKYKKIYATENQQL